MSAQLLQSLVVATACLVMAVVVLFLARSQKLSFRYAVGWLLFLGFGAVSGAVLPVAEPIAGRLSVTPGVIVSSVAVLALLAICIQLSISISGLQEQVRNLAEEVALLRTESPSDDTVDERR